MKASDFSVPRRMSGSAFVIILIKSLRDYAGLFLTLAIFCILDSERTLAVKVEIFAVLSAAYLTLSAAAAAVNWYFKKYYVDGGNLIFIHGVLAKKTTSIPLGRIQSMRTRRGFIYRVLELRGVLFDTLASKSAEIELVLDDNDWKALLSRVEMQEQAADEKNPETEETEKADGGAVRMSFGNLNLIKGAFCQNHLQGMAVLFAAFAAVYNTISTVDDHAVTRFIEYVDTHAGALSFRPSAYVAVAAALYLVVMLLWIGKVFLRYAGMEVIMDRGMLTFESGLIARNSSRFSHDKVCTVYVKRNFLEKRLHGSTIVLRQALNATDEQRGANMKIYGSDAAPRFLEWWIGKDYGCPENIISAQSGAGLAVHATRTDMLVLFSATIILCCLGLYTWTAIPAIWLPISIAKGAMAVRRGGITLKEGHMEISSGKFADIRNYIKYDNIEVVRLKSTPFTRFSHRVNLTLSTNGSTFTVRSLKEREAREIHEMLLFFLQKPETA